MLRVLKRFKLLVSLLLLCGCLASFSSVSFAADVFSGHRLSSSDSTNGVISRIVASSSDPWVEFETLSSISADTAYTMYRGYIKDYYTVTLENTNDFPTYLASGEEMYLQAYCANPTYGSYFSTDNGFTISIEETKGCHISSIGIGSLGSPSSQVYFYLDDTHYHDGNLVLKPHETVTVSFTAIREYSVHVSDNDTNLHLEKQLIHDGLQGAYINSVTLFNEPITSYTGNATITPSPSQDYNNYNVVSSGLIVDGSNVGYISVRSFDSYISSVNSSPDGRESGLITLPIQIDFSNSSNKPIKIEFSSVSLPLPYFTFNNSNKIADQINYKLSNIVAHDSAKINYWYYNLFCFPAPNDLVDGGLIIPAGERVVYSFDLIYSFDFVRGFSDTSSYSFTSNITSVTLNDGIISFSDTSYSNSTDSLIEQEISQSQQQHQEQMQQQQQQHDEQLQQSQEQYDEFTDDGSAEGESFISGTDSAVKEKIGIFTFLDTMLENLLGLFDAPEGDAVITFPAFSMEVGGETHQIWADTQFNLSSLDDDFSVLLTAVRFGTVAVVYFALINFLGDTYSRIFGGKSE